MASQLEQTQLDIIDVLDANGGAWDASDGEVLVTLAAAITGQDEKVGGNAYKRVSLAVVALEAIGFVTVERRYEARSRKANIIERITLA